MNFKINNIDNLIVGMNELQTNTIVILDLIPDPKSKELNQKIIKCSTIDELMILVTEALVFIKNKM